jgi:hypothetical protein
MAVAIAGILLLTGTLDPFLKMVETVYAQLSKGIVSEAALKVLKDAGVNVDAFTKGLAALGLVASKTPVEITGPKLDPEAAAKLQAFNNELLKLQTQAREVGGEFNRTLAPGFLQAAISAKIVHEDMSNLEAVLSLTDQKAQQLNDKMLLLAGAKLTQEFQSPWQQFNETLEKTNLLLEKNKISSDTFQQASIQAAAKIADSYGQAAQTITGGFADAFKTIAEKNREWAGIAKAAAIAQAIANTAVAVTKALASLPPPFSYAAAAAVGIAGAVQVAKISATEFQTGGSFKIGGIGGIDSQMVAFKATPGEMVDVRKPGATSGQVVDVAIPRSQIRDFFTGKNLSDFFDVLNAAHSDGYRLKFT